MPIFWDILSMLSAVAAEDCANFARPATAVDAPATIAVPHFAAVLMPFPSLDEKDSAFSPVSSIALFASALSTAISHA